MEKRVHARKNIFHSSSSKISGFPVANNFNDIFISFKKEGWNQMTVLKF